MRRQVLLTAAGIALAGAAWQAQAQGDEWQAGFRVGQQVQFSVSENPADFQPCVVSENPPGGLMRVKCQAFKHWAAGTYIVYGPKNLRMAGAAAQVRPAAPARAPAAAVRQTPAPAARGGGLKVGEYACYGSGSRILAGAGFKVLGGGRYTDLDGQSRGTYTISGDKVIFNGGHLGGQTGYELNNGRFRIRTQAVCEPW